MSERRRGRRYRCVLWVRFGTDGHGEWSAIGRDLSTTGLMMAVGPRLEVGSTLSLSFRLDPAEPDAHHVTGRVVRFDAAGSADGLWPHRVAIEFDEQPVDLEAAIGQFAERCEVAAAAFEAKVDGEGP